MKQLRYSDLFRKLSGKLVSSSKIHHGPFLLAQVKEMA
jgi:hypothetical protein